MSVAQPEPEPPRSLWTARFGPHRLGLRFLDGGTPGRGAWFDPPGLAVDFQLDVTSRAQPGGPLRPVYQVLGEGRFAFQSETVDGQGDWHAGTGVLQLRGPEGDSHARVNGVLQGLVATTYARLVELGGTLLHAAVLVLDGRAWVVLGPSGAGKTTLAERFDGQHLSDEGAFLVPGADGWRAWRHAEFRGSRGELPWDPPVAGVWVLAKDRTRTAAASLSRQDAFAAVMQQVFVPAGVGAQHALAVTERLVNDFEVQALSHCLRDPVSQVRAVLTGTR